MKDIKIDLSKFKHVAQDGHTHTLRHYEGHEIKIAGNKLSKENRAALQAMAEKAQAKAAAKGDGKPSTNPDMLAEGGRVVTNIRTSDTSKGVDLANKTRKEGDASPNGITIENPGKDRSKDHGKVTGPDGKKAQVFAEGGDVIPEIPPALSPDIPMDPTGISGIPDFSAKGMAQATATTEPAAKFDQMKLNYPWLSDSEALTALDKKDAELNSQALERDQASVAQQQAAMNVIQQKQAHGIPLSPAETASLASTQAPAATTPPMAADPALSNVAHQMQQAPAANPGMGGMADMEGMLSGGYNKAVQGIMQGAKAQGDLGAAQAQLLDQQVKAQTEAKAAYQQHYDELEQERQAHMQDIKDGYINPEKYWTGDAQGNGSHSKIAAGIGMILAGFNPTSSPNAAINFLHYQMDKNLEAQKANLGAKENLLSANLRQFGNLKDATEMTRIMQNDVLAHQLQSAAATAQTPMAKAAALQAAGQLQMQVAPQMQQFAMRRAMMNLANGQNGQDPSNTAAAEQMISYARVMNPEMAKEMEGRLVPGVGMAKIPVPQDVRSEMIGKKNFDQLATQYMKFAQENTGSWSPEKIAKGAAMAAELQGAYRQASKGGVYKEGEQNFIERLIPSDPTQYLASMRTLPKLKTLIQTNNQQLNQLSNGYGLPAKAPVQSNEPQFKVVNGVKYMRGPDGKPVKVN